MEDSTVPQGLMCRCEEHVEDANAYRRWRIQFHICLLAYYRSDSKRAWLYPLAVLVDRKRKMWIVREYINFESSNLSTDRIFRINPYLPDVWVPEIFFCFDVNYMMQK
jgi:hypothetical protein